MTEIEQMAKLACTVFEGRCSGCPCKLHSPCAPKASAERLYTAGYRKASEVAKEIFRELEASFCILAYPVVTAVGTINTERAEGLHIRTEDYETIKKIYTEGEK